MPRFYGDRMDTIIENGMTLEDAMRITNSSPNSEEADYGTSNTTDEEIIEILGLEEEENDG